MKTRIAPPAHVLGLALVIVLAGCLDPDEPGNLVPKTVDEDPSLPAIELNGTRLHAETFGDPAAPVIIMLHGGPGQDYRRLMRLRQPVDGVRLEDRHFVVFWDQRGAGVSRRHDPGDITGPIYEADLAAVADKYSPGRPVVFIGHSWGGMYASEFISHHPERVAGAVLMDSGPLTGALYEEVKGGIQKLDLWSEWLNDITWGETVVTPEGHARLDYAMMLGAFGDSQPGYHIPNPPPPTSRYGAVVGRVLQSTGFSGGKAVWDFTTGLGQYQHKVLFEGGERSEVIGAEFQRRQMTAYASADLVVIQGEGHEFPWTAPEATLRPIFTYLTAIGF